ncbi:hypothetical protein D3C78_1426740 [compost metagenome]
MQELLDILGQANAVIEVFGIFRLVIVKFEQEIEGEVLDLLSLLFAEALHRPLELVADIIAMHGLVADDEADQIRRIGKLGAA